MKIKEYREKEKELNKKTKKELIKYIIETEEWYEEVKKQEESKHFFCDMVG